MMLIDVSKSIVIDQYITSEVFLYMKIHTWSMIISITMKVPVRPMPAEQWTTTGGDSLIILELSVSISDSSSSFSPLESQ